jgi:hypothetical protein
MLRISIPRPWSSDFLAQLHWVTANYWTDTDLPYTEHPQFLEIEYHVIFPLLTTHSQCAEILRSLIEAGCVLTHTQCGPNLFDSIARHNSDFQRHMFVGGISETTVSDCLSTRGLPN